ncbi:ABC transporter substrate-binding protein [Geodermatophilus sp. URMC 64]
MRRTGKLRGRGIAVVGVAALLTAACGDDGGGGSGADLSGSPVVLGVLANASGPIVQGDPEALEVLEAWADWTNDNGGISGHPVELRVEDTRGDPATAVAGAEGLVADPSVVGVVHLSVITEGAVGDVFAESDLAVVGGYGYNPTVWGALPNWNMLTTSFPHAVNLQVAAAVNVGAQSVAAVACAEDPSCLAAAPVFEAATEDLGVDYTGALQVASTAPNYTAECLEIIDRGTEYLQVSLQATSGAKLAGDCIRQGYEGWFGASNSTLGPELYEVPDIRMAGGINAFPWWIDSEPVQEYRDAMDEYGVEESSWERPYSTGAWAAGELFKKALSGIGEDENVTRQTVANAYAALSDETLDGLLPQPVSFSPGEPSPTISCYWLYQFEDGEFDPDVGDPVCEEPAG